MKFAKWIVFTVFFALAENVPVNEPSLDEHSIVDILSRLTSQFVEMEDKGVTVLEKRLEKNVIGVICIITGAYAEQQFRPPNNIQIKIQMRVILKAHLKDFNHTRSFGTGDFPVDLGITWNNGTAKIHLPDVDNLELKLLPNDYQYKPNEEEKVKQAIKSLIQNTILKSSTNGGEYVQTMTSLMRSKEADNSREVGLLSKNLRYSLGTISSSNYTLNNLTIDGLWQVESVSYNSSNLEVSPQIVIGSVVGYMDQKFHSTPDKHLELSFTANNISISINQTAGFDVNVQIGEYTLKNTKTNSFLGKSNLIVKDIESAIATSGIVTDWKKYIEKLCKSKQEDNVGRIAAYPSLIKLISTL